LVLAPGADTDLLTALAPAYGATGRGATLVVGAEQGLDAAELAALAGAGFRPAHCGSGILRAVTAVVAATAAAALARG
jgi:16S rRNA U1498 N3-methylase RsmE